ncbi:hypothetical protein GIB67_001593 [Kingdonia uniflora]|uniref:RAVE complex protein Rav1 C-terminal domain-containing protein n=1 Tax=Kingdonia uniflora TaxID=39325 RepID=A0A7J7L0W3_9MAGN|nr:hypothetical protein GIB67_001593 [Kingdonia uniflora]
MSSGSSSNSIRSEEEESIITDLLPLKLLKSETIPPSPNLSFSNQTIDILHNFSNLSWIAYGASSLLVISHFPSPLSPQQTHIGPIFRQVIELSHHISSQVKAVAWSPLASSDGEVAVAIENCVFLCSEKAGNEQGYFCWTQIAVLVQSSTVEAIKWTGSGDGIVTVGIEVVMWKRKGKTWEIAWKFMTEVPQTTVSTTWSISGPVGTAAYCNTSSSMCGEKSKHVLVCQSSEKLGVFKTELCHPQPVSMIQWRSSSGILLQRDVLLTCCLDGTVRLWCEIDSGRGKKFSKDIHARTYHVSAVIEVNQFLNGDLGTDIFVTWAIESKSTGEESEHYTPGRCEWLVGLGPGPSLTFWAVHCLDDISPLRFPRVTLWKKQDLPSPEVCRLQNSNSQKKDHSLFIKAVISRDHFFDPPNICSLFRMIPDNSITWSQLYTSASNNTNCGFLSLDGHSGNIVQVAVHPYSFEAQVAVSLDSSGSILLWSLSTISNCMLGMPTLVLPMWHLLEKKLSLKLSCDVYSSISWAPIILNECKVLLLGHAKGIDCYMIKISESEEAKIVFHKLCTIPFIDHNRRDGPSSIFAVPSPSTCTETYHSNKFVLLGVWTEEFQALSWNVAFHCDDLSGNDCGRWRFESTFCDKRYSVVVDLCSSKFPDPHDYDEVTSVSVVTPVNLMPSVLKSWGSSIALCGNSAYQMATGCSDGSLKLWRSTIAKLSNPHSELDHFLWELVGVVATCQGPVTAVSLSSCGQKIATISMNDRMDNMSSLHIWEALNVIGSGILLLEDTISLDGVVIALHWVTVGNGQLLLGVCMQNEMRVYVKRKFSSQIPLETHSWVCVASGHTSQAARDFFWGPGASLVLVYESVNELSVNEKSEECKPILPKKMNVDNNHQSYLEVKQQQLPAGNWRRACVAVRHLVGYLTSNKTSTTGKGYDFTNSSHNLQLINLPNYFEVASHANLGDSRLQWGSDANGFNSEFNASNPVFSSSENSEISGFIKTLENFPDIEAISYTERMQILAVIDLLVEISDLCSASPYGSLDEPGRRFWVAVRFQQLYFLRRFGSLASMNEWVVDSGMIAWALQSDCQENLFSSVLSNEPSWEEMRKFGVGFWFTNVAQLRTKMEKLARVQYLKNKDPKDCALLYISLNRIQVLAALFKVSKNEKDKPLVAFLSRNFQEEKNKAAALKNAYVLMGRHQLELAIAFFLLGGDFSSAVTVCAKNLGDAQLALIICRLLEGYGGPLERHLISKFLLPSATEKRDSWLVSLLEWVLGNYSEACMGMLGFHLDPRIDKSILPTNKASFLDPKMGQYCLLLVTKHSLKNSIGESAAAILGRWATLIASSALNRNGLHLEALECLSSSFSNIEGKDEASISEIRNHGYLHGMLNVFPENASNWISGDVALQLESNTKLNLALRYISTLIMEHPSWSNPMLESCEPFICSREYEDSLENFQQKLKAGLITSEQKYSLNSVDLINMGHIEKNTVASHPLHPTISHLFLKATGEVSRLFARCMVACRISCDLPDSTLNKRNLSEVWEVYMRGLGNSLKGIKAMLELCFFPENIRLEASTALDLLELLLLFASAWLQKNLKLMILIVHPILVTHSLNSDNASRHSEVDLTNLKKLCKSVEFTHDSLSDENSERITYSIPKDERWHLIGVCLWRHLSTFTKNRLMSVSDGIENGGSLANLLKSTLDCISSSHVRHFEQFLTDKVEKGYHPIPTLEWLEESYDSRPRDLSNHLHHGGDLWELIKNKSEESLFDILWEISADPKEICDAVSVENIRRLQSHKQKSSKDWSDIHKAIMIELENDGTSNNDREDRFNSSSSNGGTGSQDNLNLIVSKQKGSSLIKAVTCFQNPKELYKKNGELLEAICINNIDQQQAALASNRKGILFFNLKDEEPYKGQSYTWSGADWPQNGWAGSESTPMPTFVSPGIGLGSKKGAHLGLGGATVGLGSYAGNTSPGLGWGTQEEFEEFVDPPATVDNIRTRALSSHPSRPFFLAGSSNTHVYLWEFGKAKATATYGVLPAANVPPPYALASISSLQFDHCGHRFTTAALDGTICTWQLEVGGRSNICPTQSSLCFNNHAADVTYVAASGSVIAASGYNSNNVNVVVWDTLAPPTTSQVSLTCHEGGARSLSVFDNDIGTGSVSPFIVTGGKGGDVGLHDFRFIATGKTKRHRQSNATEQHKFGERNSNGMLCEGSVTRIVTIPNTSMFLTGSKDGDVKLWDAKRSELIFCWTGLHERHTFLQPSSRGFGGVVRAGVTDIQVCNQGFLSCGGDDIAQFFCHSGNYGDVLTVETSKAFHRKRVRALAESGADLIAFETIPNKLEVTRFLKKMTKIPA